MGRVEEALAPLFPPGREADRQRAARVLWAGVHGITSLSTADKLSVVTTETANRLVDDLVATYLAGLASGAERHPRPARRLWSRPRRAKALGGVRRLQTGGASGGDCAAPIGSRWAMALA